MKLFLAGAAAMAAVGTTGVPCLMGAFSSGDACEASTSCCASAAVCVADAQAPTEFACFTESACSTVSACGTVAEDVALRGDYVEGRTASVYAGACHYGGEYTIAGREAVLAWSIEAGRIGGVDLAGTDVVVVVSGDQNLAEAEVAKRSVVFLPEAASPAQREALLSWLDPELVGEVTNLVLTDVECAREGERFDVRAGEAVALQGALLPNRECCAMPFNVWYEPFVPVEGAVVGCTENFACDADELDVHFTSKDENCVFAAAFAE